MDELCGLQADVRTSSKGPGKAGPGHVMPGNQLQEAEGGAVGEDEGSRGMWQGNLKIRTQPCTEGGSVQRPQKVRRYSQWPFQLELVLCGRLGQPRKS